MLAFINQSVLVPTMFLETFLFFFSQSHLDIHNGDSLMAVFPLKFPTIFWLSEWVKLLSRVWLFATPWTVAHQGSSVHGILQARILKWVAISFSRGSSWPRDRTQVSCIAGRHFNLWATREAPFLIDTFNFLSLSSALFSWTTQESYVNLHFKYFF